MTEPAPQADAEVQPRWGLGDAALAFLAGLVVSVVTSSLYVAVSGADPNAEDTGLIIATLVGLWMGFGGGAILASRRKGTGSLGNDYGLRVEAKDVPLGIVVGLVCQFVLVPVVVTLFSLIDDSVDVGQQATSITGDAGGLRLLILAPFLCLGAPFFEELFFRGLLQRAAARRLGGVGGIILSATAFGLVHANALSGWSTVALVVALGAFGAVLSTLTHRSGRLGPAMVTHFTFNFVTIVALAFS